MGLAVVGISHKSAPIELRERLATGDEELTTLLDELKGMSGVTGALVASTCNRFEIWLSAAQPAVLRDPLSALLARRAQQPGDRLATHLYWHVDDTAVRHIFRVCASLDSMVVGEAQILGQIKQAAQAANSSGALDALLNRCLAKAVQVAKEVRTATGIGRHAVSVPTISVGLAKKVFGELDGHPVLLIGAGKMSEVAAKSLLGQGAPRILVANRSRERAQAMAKRLGAQAFTLDDLPRLLTEVDIVISQTGSKSFILQEKMVREALPKRRYRPLFIIDIAVPRDVDPQVAHIDNVYLFDIDDLQKVAEHNLGERQKEAQQAERLVAQKAELFARSLLADRVTPTLVRLRDRLTTIKDEELSKAKSTLETLSERDRAKVDKLAHALVNRILHEPTLALKRMAERSDPDEALQLVESLFAIGESAAAPAPQPVEDVAEPEREEQP